MRIFVLVLSIILAGCAWLATRLQYPEVFSLAMAHIRQLPDWLMNAGIGAAYVDYIRPWLTGVMLEKSAMALVFAAYFVAAIVFFWLLKLTMGRSNTETPDVDKVQPLGDLKILHGWENGIPRSAARFTAGGVAVILTTVVGFGYWATTALIAGAIITSGSFVATGENKIIQHFEGGVISKILVREGDIVNPDQVLIELDDTAPKAELRRLILREARAKAMSARLQAEMDDLDKVEFPAELLEQKDDADFSEILQTESNIMRARRSSLKSQMATLEDGIGALRERISGGEKQLVSVHRQLALIEEEIAAKQNLLKKALIRKPEVLALQRAQSSLTGEIGRLEGEIGDARERTSRIREQMASMRHSMVQTIIEQMQQVTAEFKDVRERKRSAQATLTRMNIVAPVRGIVVRLRYHTPGGVIEAGKSILELLPVQEELIIEARVKPQDIDNVKLGQSATVRLTAANRRITPTVDGVVIYVSADSLQSEQAGAPNEVDSYLARIRLNASEVQQLADFSITSGMPVEVFIKTAERTFLEYLTKPIVDSMSRAFREL